jgi:hypothetical protein
LLPSFLSSRASFCSSFCPFSSFFLFFVHTQPKLIRCSSFFSFTHSRN